MKHIVLVTGSRYANNKHGDVIASRMLGHASRAAESKAELWLVHGAARGVDQLVMSLGQWDQVVAFPAPWDRLGKAAGHVRNGRMVSYLKEQRQWGAAIWCEAFPLGESPGTRGCIKLTESAGIPTKVTELDP